MVSPARDSPGVAARPRPHCFTSGHFKVLLMSATLQAEGFAKYFADAFPEDQRCVAVFGVGICAYHYGQPRKHANTTASSSPIGISDLMTDLTAWWPTAVIDRRVPSN